MAEKKESIWTHDYIILFVSHMFMMLSSQMMNTLLPLYYKSLGASDAFVGVVASVFYFAALAFRPFSGPAIDAINRKKLFIVLSLIYAFSIFGYAVSPNIQVLICFRLLHGMAYGSLAALCLTMASSALSPSVIASGVAIFALSSVLPQAIGPGIGLALSERFGYRIVYLASSCVLLCSGLMGFALHGDGKKSEKIRINLKTIFVKEATIPALMLACYGLCAAAITSFMVITMRERAVEGISFYYTITAASMIAARPMIGKLADKYGIEKILPVCLGIFAVHMVCLATCHSTAQLWACALLNTLGYGSCLSLTQALAMRVTPAERRGAGSSTCYIGTDLGTMLGSTLAGALAGQFGYGGLYFFEVIPVILASVLLLTWIRQKGEMSPVKKS